MHEITMPQLSEDMREGKLLRWCVKEGEPVREGDVIAEVETDKANMEVEATVDGTVTQFLAKPGDAIPVGAIIARYQPTEQ